MSFLSVRFLLFVAITAVVYYLYPIKKNQWVVLLAASCSFYLFTGVKYIIYLLVTAATSYFAAVIIQNLNSVTKAALKENRQAWDKEQKKLFKEASKRKTRRIMVLALLVNFGILFILKYLNFLTETFGNLFGFSAPVLHLILPLGISFYTFQAMGYVIDVYRGDVEAERNFGKLLLFISFFPQILQGPISRYDQLACQLYDEHHVDFTRIKYGLELMLWGYFKKLVIADRAWVAIQTVITAPESYTGTTLGFIVLLYALQLYADFSAGIDITRAVAQILGIDMIQNFRQPYFATSLTDYWNRWHISLGAWMKNYLFYPIALSQTASRVTKTIRSSRFGSTKAGAHIAVVLPGTVASLIIFLVVGIWHGAGWRYILYGIWNGGIIMLSMLLKPVFESFNRFLHVDTKSVEHHLFQIVRTFLLVCIGNITDLARGGRDCFVWLRRILFEQNPVQGFLEIQGKLGLTAYDYRLLTACTILLYVVGILRERTPQTPLRELLDRRLFLTRWIIIVCCLVAILVFGTYGPGFSASEFAYMQF